MPYAANGVISQEPIAGGVAISQQQYALALAGMLAGKTVSIDGGFAVLSPPPPPEASPEPSDPLTLGDALAIKFAELDRVRQSVEEGGILFGGMPLKTDRQTASIITAAYVKAKDDPGFLISNWKFADGVFAPLDAPTIIDAGDAITAHVQAAFDREAALSAELLALVSIEDVMAFDVLERWWGATE